MANNQSPYMSPESNGKPSISLPTISDEVVNRLIKGVDVTRLAFYDVSDCQLYGRKYKRLLKGMAADKAEKAGCYPKVYQAIDWLCLVYIPVWPLGTYVVMKEKFCDDPDGDADQYRCVRVSMDVKQIVCHYFAVALILAVASLMIWKVASSAAAPVTGQFSRDAAEYIDRIEGKTVVLIDGEQLTGLMIDHGVGVTRTKSYELADLSQDFFSEDGT